MFRLKIKYLKLVSTIDQIEIDEEKTIGDIKNYAKGKHPELNDYNLVLIFNGRIHKDEHQLKNCLVDDRTVFITLLKSNSLDIRSDRIIRPSSQYSNLLNTIPQFTNIGPRNSFQQTLDMLLTQLGGQVNVPNYTSELQSLENLGFTDRRRNTILLSRYGGDLNTVVNILMDE